MITKEKGIAWTPQPKFKHGDLLVDTHSKRTRIVKVDSITQEEDGSYLYKGRFLDPILDNLCKRPSSLPEYCARLATLQETNSYLQLVGNQEKRYISFS